MCVYCDFVVIFIVLIKNKNISVIIFAKKVIDIALWSYNMIIQQRTTTKLAFKNVIDDLYAKIAPSDARNSKQFF